MRGKQIHVYSDFAVLFLLHMYERFVVELYLIPRSRAVADHDSNHIGSLGPSEPTRPWSDALVGGPDGTHGSL